MVRDKTQPHKWYLQSDLALVAGRRSLHFILHLVCHDILVRWDRAVCVDLAGVQAGVLRVTAKHKERCERLRARNRRGTRTRGNNSGR